MPDFSKLDKRFGLTPWLLKEHAAHVAAAYGALLAGEPGKAEEYVNGYEAAEKRSDEAYRLQQDLLLNATKDAGGEPQALPAQEKIEWDPRKLFAAKAPAKEPKPKKEKETEKETEKDEK